MTFRNPTYKEHGIVSPNKMACTVCIMCLSLTLPLCPTPLWAQNNAQNEAQKEASSQPTPSPTTSRVLSLSECLQMALENNHRIVAAEAQRSAAESQVRSAKALYRPQLSIEASALYTSTDGTYDSGSGMLPVFGAEGVPNGTQAYFPGIQLDYEIGMIVSAGLKLEQPIYMGGKIKAGNGMAKLGEQIAQQNIRLTKAEVKVETARAYATVVQCKELTHTARAYNALLQELMRTVTKAHQHGMKPKNDVLKVQVKLDESLLNIRKAENGLRLATLNLCYYTGLPMEAYQSVDVDTVLPTPTEGVEGQTAPQDVSSRPEWQMLEQKSLLSEQQVKSAKAERLPQVGLMGQVGYTNGVELNGEKLIDGCSFMVGAQVTIPIDLGHKSHKVRQAKAEQLQVESERADTNQRMMLEANQAANNWDEAMMEITMAEAQVASAEENLRSSSKQYASGKETLSDHLEAQTLWQQAQSELIKARTNAFVRWMEYCKATGQLE